MFGVKTTTEKHPVFIEISTLKCNVVITFFLFSEQTSNMRNRKLKSIKKKKEMFLIVLAFNNTYDLQRVNTAKIK